MYEGPRDWIYVAWLIVIFVIVICSLHACRPSFLLEDCECENSDECEHCELHPMLTLWTGIFIAFVVIIVMWCIINASL